MTSSFITTLTQTFRHSAPVTRLLAEIDRGRPLVLNSCQGAARAFLVQVLQQNRQQPLLCLFPRPEEARQFYDDLAELLPASALGLFSPHERQLWNEVGPLGSVVGQRLNALGTLMRGGPAVVVTSAPALLEKVADPARVARATLSLLPGQEYPFSGLIESLVHAGYVREHQVERPGEMAVRGGLIDLFLFEENNPLRIEFWGDRIESIRQFDLQTQRSLEPVTHLSLLPLSAAGIYAPFFDPPFDQLPLSALLTSYMPKQTTIILFDNILISNELEDYEKESSVRFETQLQEHQTEGIAFADYFGSRDEIIEAINTFQTIELNTFNSNSSLPLIEFSTQRNNHFAGNLKLFYQEVEARRRVDAQAGMDSQFAILCDSETQTLRLRDLLTREAMHDIHVETLNLSEGFQWPEQHLYLYTDRELYGRVRLGKADKASRRAVSFAEMLKLQEGDFVVHVEFGVGIFRGLKPIDAYGRVRECMQIEYAGGDMLYVPLEKMDQVQKYSSRDGYVPVLNKLGGREWEKLKSRTKSRVKEVASQLIKLYAVRKLRPGHAFPSDTIWQKELEASFKYDETLDQLNAVNEIKADMEKGTPMDRLVCGDVGFGKTEVAVRAAFKALMDGKQVAVLVPTTVLAQQHFATFSERLARYPVRIAVLSRFKNARQLSEIIQQVGRGEVDLVIGTHRLLSKDVQFRNLGLLIIDEEQKFGVLHKERLKLLKVNVDTLTLSATPIPRTLHMALMGARDMSLINTPPGNRLPIVTEVCRFERDHIREVMLREVERKGQIFFIHNRVATIAGIHHLLAELVPEIHFAVAHGQMEARELEKVMSAFAEGQVHCLICSMIIESGIDVPNANTLIVNRADRFGLAQLYQLRGRVGRSDHQAYAYFLIPPLRKLTRTAIKRLQTIQECSHLGSGYKIAMRDLEIRGAGNIFGSEQSGFVDALGYELYAKIIEEAIQELRDELNLPQRPRSAEEPQFAMESRIEMTGDAFLPNTYVEAAADRVDIYKRLIEAKTVQAIQDLEDELRDRFGALPDAARNLIDYVLVKMLAHQARIEEIGFKNGRISGKFFAAALPKGEQFRPWLGKMVEKACYPFELRQSQNTLFFEIAADHKATAIEQMKKFLESII
ncbi:MAG TPA: transcription-repair coupling factor [bacterium]|nr:transcription-repair coupling factor [bacterium]HQG44094.1 transcription-repair coupling factor [bacterium]HQI47567.1 transcription-repair coupling factor [bacterium]HQJ63343.1 transcription-repair coupling factor [bacterium]